MTGSLALKAEKQKDSFEGFYIIQNVFPSFFFFHSGRFEMLLSRGIHTQTQGSPNL